ncbi:hypothetical protein DH2020_002107 [Rehmannia glutinosa]|uniref:RNase H type-1 domain-containing protein n=1 Tax=Rehmannia glutinosa TaxID=99300 RepID=A0ABR0XSX0_REHGL
MAIRSRGIEVDTVCTRCGLEMETVGHALRDCPWSELLWAISPLRLSLPAVDLRGSLADWIENFKKQGNAEGAELFAMNLWGVWWARKHLVFNGKNLTQQQVVEQVMKRLDEHRGVADHQRISSVLTVSDTWVPPEQGIYKLNSDASIREGGGIGVGMIIRDSRGQTFQSLIQHFPREYEVDVAEAIACREGLIFARNLGLKSVVVETDCSNLYYKLKRKTEVKISHTWGILLVIFWICFAHLILCVRVLLKDRETLLPTFLRVMLFHFLVWSR